eukprot:COSAG05_NODE_1772_length_4112_cov_1.452529_5_plen_45_part_00
MYHSRSRKKVMQGRPRQPEGRRAGCCSLWLTASDLADADLDRST